MQVTYVHNASKVAASLTRKGDQVEKAMDGIIGRSALIAVNKIQARAPVDEGTLKRSINAQRVKAGVWSVGTNVVYARRLEFGFMNMTDSLGRTYRQPPQPYMLPGMQDALPEIRSLISKEIRSVVR